MGRARRLYQDRFCGLRLNRLRAGYEDHCRGEACEHFAPAALLTVRRPLAAAEAAAAGRSRPRGQRRLLPRWPGPRSRWSRAIMPTRQRPDFALQAVRYFLAQDYPRTELVVLEDGTPSLTGRLPDDPRIRYIATEGPARSIGAMRNEACRLARGDIVAHWDDDDWYGPERLTRQVAAIRDRCGRYHRAAR